MTTKFEKPTTPTTQQDGMRIPENLPQTLRTNTNAHKTTAGHGNPAQLVSMKIETETSHTQLDNGGPCPTNTISCRKAHSINKPMNTDNHFSPTKVPAHQSIGATLAIKGTEI